MEQNVEQEVVQFDEVEVQNNVPEEKTVTLVLNAQNLEMVWLCIENSSASHILVKNTQGILSEQLKGQLDEQGRIK